MQKAEFLKSVSRHLNQELVRIDADAIRALGLDASQASLVGGSFPFQAPAICNADGSLHRDAAKVVRYLLVLTSLQYRFWSKDAAGFHRYIFEGAVGSTGMMKAFDRAWGSQLEPATALLLASQSEEGVKEVFGDIPDAASRQRILAEALSPRALTVCDAIARTMLDTRAAGVSMANIIAEELPVAYGDLFLKKAMLLLGFVASWARGSISVADELCAYADYQVPSVLRHFGVLKYIGTLALEVDNQEVLERGGVKENAIRAATVLACEDIAAAYGVTAAEVDWWAFMQRKAPTKPFHLVETTHY